MSGCIFCAIQAGALPAAIVHEDAHCLAFMDAYPLRPGHVLVIPRRHAVLMTELQASERTQLIELGNRIARAMRKLDPACDINWIVNDGKAANQHVPHVHLHLIPRQPGDGAAMLARFSARPLTMLRAPSLAKLEPYAARLRAALQ